MEVRARQWSIQTTSEVKCLGQRQSQTPRQGRYDGPITQWRADMRWRKLAQEVSLASRPDCRTIRADPFVSHPFCLLFSASTAHLP